MGGDRRGIWQPAAALLEVLSESGGGGGAPGGGAAGPGARHIQAAVTALVDITSAGGASGAVPWLEADRAAATSAGALRDPSTRTDPAETSAEAVLGGAGLARALARAALAASADAEGSLKKGDMRFGAGAQLAAVRLLAALRCCAATSTIGTAILCYSHLLGHMM